jgi:protein gp37
MPTPIEWTEETWNPTRGCSRVSEGCRNCYAEKQALRFSANGQPFQGFTTKVNGHAAWTGRVELIEKRLEEPLHWKRPRRVFVNSMSDLFHESLPDAAIDRVVAVMARCPQHTFQILTKRPDRMRAYITAGFGFYARRRVQDVLKPVYWRLADRLIYNWPLPNVWLGVSVEDQATADSRIPVLLKTPSAVRFVSYEPALGLIDFRNIREGTIDALSGSDFDQITSPPLRRTSDKRRNLPPLDWVIVGGESGPGARPFDIEWARSVINQCRLYGVACFVKQIGACSGVVTAHHKGGNPDEWPPDLRVREYPQVKMNWRSYES